VDGAIVARPTQERGTRDDRDEGCDTRDPERASRQRFSEHDHAGRDRQCVRPESRDAGSRQRPAALKSELQRDEGESVAREQRRNERQVEAAGDGSLRADVTCGVEDTGGHAQTGSAAEEVGCRTGC